MGGYLIRVLNMVVVLEKHTCLCFLVKSWILKIKDSKKFLKKLQKLPSLLKVFIGV